MRRGRQLWRGGTALLTSTLVATLLMVGGVLTPSEDAVTEQTSGTTYLCTGYTGCRNAGYSDAGYGAVNDQMYWRMYSGHNCTNYAAYRMIQAGMSTDRPWDGSGMAYNWGYAMADVTDDRPSVGAVAWWDRYYHGIGSSGHVAYVERVISADEIVISEDSWSGDFHWRTITRDSGRWPSGFVHFVDKAVQNTEVPVISGAPQVGVELAVSRGGWEPSRHLTITRQWYADGTPIDGATSNTFTPTVDQKGAAITVTLTATRPGYSPALVTTAPTAPVARGEFTMLTPPTVSGEAMVDEVLSATPATWSPASDDILYRWLADGELIEGANGPDLTVTRDLVGKSIVAATHARAPGYKNDPERSEPIGPVVIGQIAQSAPSTVAGRTRVGQVLTVTAAPVTPADAAVAYQWLRDGTPVDGATTPTYTLTGDDLGATMYVQVVRTRRNYADLVETVPVAGMVTTKPTLTLGTSGRSHKAVVWIRATAPGASVDGDVTVKVGTKVVTVAMTGGRAKVVVKDLAAGDRRIRVRYAGDGPVRPARARTMVHVLP
ncbi:CHAP domain-containing protein [Nocardioides humilatus]|uniref:CHAP domain-containing protein n=1 Tax=Nocardioides humilatus TaxID=2607660 RepID=A0A5B1LGQ4_9ACTN|nr:CHAP domain-containing protein [Nocardioides humilatus]KAA1418807.1 CHAP domain-containing protein [Nocardioides humilatus]